MNEIATVQYNVQWFLFSSNRYKYYKIMIGVSKNVICNSRREVIYTQISV